MCFGLLPAPTNYINKEFSSLPCPGHGEAGDGQWELAVPTEVSSSGHNHRELEMGGKLSKPHTNICILRAFPSIGER